VIHGSLLLAISKDSRGELPPSEVDPEVSLVEVFQDGRLLEQLKNSGDFTIKQLGGGGYTSPGKGGVMIRRYAIHGKHEELEKKFAMENVRFLKAYFKIDVPEPTSSGDKIHLSVQTVKLGPSVDGPNMGIEIAKVIFDGQPEFAVLTATMWEFD